MSDVIIKLGLAFMEKEALRVFLQKAQDDDPLMMLGAQELADKTGVSRPRAYAILSQLEEKKVLQKIERKGFILTYYGSNLLNEMAHRMKILEVFCHKELGMSIISATKEASQLVLSVSYEFIEILCDRLDRPTSCPHDTPIPHHTKHPDDLDLVRMEK